MVYKKCIFILLFIFSVAACTDGSSDSDSSSAPNESSDTSSSTPASSTINDSSTSSSNNNTSLSSAPSSTATSISSLNSSSIQSISSSGVVSSGSAASSSSALGGESGCGDAEARAVFQNNGCLNCHDAQNFGNIGGNLNLDSGNVGQRMLEAPTLNGGMACANEKLIDINDPSNSLILKLTNSNSLAQLAAEGCIRNPMPPSGRYMPADDYSCIAQWAANIAANETPINDNDNTPKPFSPSGSGEALSKAKYILHGEAPTAAEITALGDSRSNPDATALMSMIESWESSPQYEAKVIDFLNISLQQKSDSRSRYTEQFNNIINRATQFDALKLIDNYSQLFIKTAYDIFDSEGDFRDVVTTRRWKVTTAALIGMIYLEKENQSPNRSYLQNPRPDDRFRAFEHFTESDFEDWRTIEITQSNTAYNYENTAEFAAVIRAIPDGGSIPLRYPRVGFFSSPSFHELWPTNDDNQFRVTTQQTLITALDMRFDPSDATLHMSEEGIPPEHIDPESTCYQCHRLMDPMRLIFSNFQNSRNRSKPTDNRLQPSFAMGGVSDTMATAEDFAQLLIEHPRFASAWVQKLCLWANSQRCEENDNEFIRLANVFSNTNYNLKLLIREFFASPIFNATSLVSTHETNEYFISLSRANHFCHAIAQREQQLKTLNDTDGSLRLCDNNGNFGIIQPDLFGRGKTDFIQTTHMAAFDAKSIDRMCAENARRVFANGQTRLISTADGVPQALEQLVTIIMGIPSNHHRYDEIYQGLEKVFSIAFHKTPCESNINPVEQDTIACGFGSNTNQALQAAWFSACTSPDLISVGM